MSTGLCIRLGLSAMILFSWVLLVLSGAFTVKVNQLDTDKMVIRTAHVPPRNQCTPCSANGTIHKTNSNICTPRNDQHNFLPDVMIVGTQKGGTTFLSNILQQHPDIATFDTFDKELHLLDQFEYQYSKKYHYSKKESDTMAPDVPTFTVDACKIQQDYRKSFMKYALCSRPFSILLEKTPAYIFRSNVIPDRLACVFPAPIKILISLRDPSKRAYSHYQMLLRFQVDSRVRFDREIDSFMAMIDPERTKIQQLGILPGVDIKEETFLAWDSLLHTNYMSDEKKVLWFPNLYILARGLYVVQVSQWIETLSTLWRMTREELMRKYILIIDNDDLMTDTQGEMNRILEFAGSVPPYEFNLVEAAGATKGESVVHNYTSLTEEEKSYLDDFYRPFNADLHHLLAPYGVELSFAKQAAESLG